MLSRKALWLLALIMAIATGILWRLEIEQHGWEGSLWLHYAHFALPVGWLLLISLALLGAQPIPLPSANARMVWTGSFGVVMLVVGGVVLLAAPMVITPPTAAIDSPLAFVTLAAGEQGLLVSWILLLLVPPLVFLISRLYGWRISRGNLVLSEILYVLSIPAGMLYLARYGLHGDHTHRVLDAVKSGIPVPFLFLSLATLFLPFAAATCLTAEQIVFRRIVVAGGVALGIAVALIGLLLSASG